MLKQNKAEEPKPATIEELQSQVNDLTKQARELKDEVFRLHVERDVLEKAAEVIKRMNPQTGTATGGSMRP